VIYIGRWLANPVRNEDVSKEVQLDVNSDLLIGAVMVSFVGNLFTIFLILLALGLAFILPLFLVGAIAVFFKNS
jgi:hypothetical protein